jgi:hypothetical protein
MKRLLWIPAATIAVGMALASISASAATVTFRVSPWAYSCGKTDPGNPTVTRLYTPNSGGCPDSGVPGSATSTYAAGKLSLDKLCLEADAATCTKDDLSSGATIGGVLHLTGFSYDWEGYCGAGAPRLNVVTSDDKRHFFGCAANNTDGHVNVNFSAAGDGSGNGGVSATDTIRSIDFVFDEAGATAITDIAIQGTAVSTTPAATPSATTAATAVPRLATTGGGSLPLLPLGLGGGLVLAGLVGLAVRRRISA